MIIADFLVKGVRQLANPASSGPVRGQGLKSLRVRADACIAAREGKIVFVGTKEEFNRSCTLGEGAFVLDGSPFIALPGFVDPHTHLPFAGTRQDEFSLKLQGVSYQEIARRGGGIMSTVKMTRQIDFEDLLDVCRKRADEMLLSGTTLAEAKSGYGLDKETELKQLEAVRALGKVHSLELVPTFMGAHEIPEAFRGRNRDYLDFLLAEVAPEVRLRNLAEFVDIFCEDGYFSVPDAAYYADGMARLGFKLKIHADEFTSNGAGILAVEKNAVSAEHLIAATEEEIIHLAASSTACVLLPGVSFFLRLGKYAPARKLIDQSALVALGSDFNPGSSMISSQLFVFWLAVFEMGLTIEEAINAVTINAACAVDRHHQAGSIDAGKKMDLLLLDIPDYNYLAYHPGVNPVHTVIKSGKVVVYDRSLVGAAEVRREHHGA